MSALPAPMPQLERDPVEDPRTGDWLTVGPQRVEIVRVVPGMLVSFRRSGLPGYVCSRSWGGWRRFCRGEA